jgi:WD40 repeat protein
MRGARRRPLRPASIPMTQGTGKREEGWTRMRILEGHTGGVRALAYQPQGTVLASGGEDGVIVLWSPLAATPGRRLEKHTDWVRGIAFSPDGRQFASVGWDSHLFEWGTVRAKEYIREKGHNQQRWSVAYSADGSLLATGSGVGRIRVYQPLTSDAPLILGQSLPTMPVTQVVFTPDSRKLLSAGHDRTVREWDAIWGGEPRIVCHSPDWIRCLALSPGGDLIAVGGDADSILLATRADDEPFAELCGHDGPVTALAFAPDGRTLLSAGRDGTARLWDVATHRPREAFDWGLGALYSLAVAPDGMTAAVGGADGRAVVWDLD